MASFRVVKEHPEHFEAEGASGSFKIGKRGLSPARVASFQAMCSGGTVQALAEGGEVKPKVEPAAKVKEQGMDLSRVRLVKEDDKAWHLSDDRGDFRVLKAGVSKGTASKIAKFCTGGQVQHLDVGGAVESGANPEVAAAIPPAAVSPAEIESGRLDGQGLPALPAGPALTGSSWDNPVDVAQSQGLAARTPLEVERGAAAAPRIEYDPTQGPPAPATPGYFPDAMARVDTAPVIPDAQAAAAAPAAPPVAPKLPTVGAGPGFDVKGTQREIGDAYRTAEAAAQAQADVAKREAADTLVQQQQNEEARQALTKQWQTTFQGWQTRGQELQRSILDQKIDPNHYWNEKGTGGKISAAIGLILGGIGSGLTKTPNAALQVIQTSIDRDIDAQKAELGKKESLLGYHLQEGHSLMAAQQLARADMLDAASAKLQMVSTKFAGDKAQATAQGAVAQLQAQAARARMEVAAQALDMGLKAQSAKIAATMFPLQYQQAAQGVEQGALGLRMTRAQMDVMSQFLNGTADSARPGQPGQGVGTRIDPRVIPLLPDGLKQTLVPLPDGTYATARSPKDAEEVIKSQEGAQVLRAKLQRYSALLAAHPHGISSTLYPEDYATARAIRDSLLTDINGLAGLNRFTSEEAKVYGGRIPDITSKALRGSALKAPLTELGREMDEKVWGMNQSYLNLPRRKMPGSR